MSDKNKDLAMITIDGEININDEGSIQINFVGSGNDQNCQVEKNQYGANNEKINKGRQLKKTSEAGKPIN